jgi:glycosyltransferase involved in cell wall biosynthesis
MSKKKILYIMHDFSRGGIQSFVYHLIKALPKDEFEPAILYYNDITSMKPEFEDIDVPIWYFSNKNIKSNYSEFKKVIDEINPDLIHFQGHEGMFTMFLWLWRMSFGNKVINTFHTSHFETMSCKKKAFEFLVQFLIKTFVHVAKETELRYSKIFHTSSNKHITIYNGIDIENIIKRVEELKKTPLFNGGVNVIGVANFHHKKGYEFSIPALHSIIRKFPQVHYHILGGYNDIEDVFNWAKNYILRNKLESNITLHGQVSDVVPYLASSDIFLCPSEREVLPISILEALSCGLPVVGTRVGGIPEILGNSNEYGVLIDSLSETKIEEALIPLIVDENLRKNYAAKSLKRASFFSIKKISKEYTTLYRECL